MKRSLIVPFLSLLLFGCAKMTVDNLFEPQTILLQSSSLNVNQAGVVTLKANVLFDNGAWCCQDAKVDFYKGDALIGTDSTATAITPPATNQGPSFSYEQTLNFVGSQDNGTNSYKAIVVFNSAKDKTVKSISSSPVSIVINIQ